MKSFIPPDRNESLTRIILDDTEYLFKFSYNYVGGFWTVGIYESNKTPVIAGIKVVPSFPLNWYVRQYIDLPNGLLFVVTKLEKIGRKDFVNGNAKFVYITKTELEENANGVLLEQTVSLSGNS